MNVKQITELVRKEAEPLARAVGCGVWDVSFTKETGEWILKVQIEAEDSGSVSIDMCEAVNRGLDKRLDELDPIEQSYCLEVSSPGLNRELKRPGDFDRFRGSEVDIKLYKANQNGEKSFTAVLLGREDDSLRLGRADGELVLKLSDIARCGLHFDF